MPLSKEERAYLEKIIQDVIKKIPPMARQFRALKLNSSLMLKEEYDFVFGFAWTSIIDATSSFMTDFRRDVTDPEMDEVFQILDKSTQRIRQAILDASEPSGPSPPVAT